MRLPPLTAGGYELVVDFVTTSNRRLASEALWFDVNEECSPVSHPVVADVIVDDQKLVLPWDPSTESLYDVVRDFCLRFVSAHYEEAALCASRLADRLLEVRDEQAERHCKAPKA